MTYTPGVTVNNGGPYSAEVELIASTLLATPGFTAWDTIFPGGLSQGAVGWINANENPAVFSQTSIDDTAGPVTSADPQTTVDPVTAMSEEAQRPY